MPRTKRPVRRQEKSTGDNDNDDALKKLDKIVAEQKKKIDARTQMEIKNIELAFKILIGSISSEYLNKTIGELKAEQLPVKEVDTVRANSSASHDDGYLTENSSHDSRERRGARKPGIPVATARSTEKRSRSADASCRKPPSTSASTRRRSRSVYRTPAYNRNAANCYPAITPKVAPHTPLTVLRQPRQGEMVVSMSGSPVMVPTYNNMHRDEMANCNIMLRDGTMLSLQPQQLRQSQAYIPFSLMDPGVLNQLKTLKDNLDKVVRLGEKAMK